MAEAIFKKMAEERGISSLLNVQSFATSDWEEGNPVYPPAASALRAHGITDFKHRSRPVTLADLKNSDYVLVMDDMNLRDIVRLTGGQYGDKIFKLGQFGHMQTDISDPYYTRDFKRAYDDIYKSCEGLLDYIVKKHAGTLVYDIRH